MHLGVQQVERLAAFTDPGEEARVRPEIRLSEEGGKAVKGNGTAAAFAFAFRGAAAAVLGAFAVAGASTLAAAVEVFDIDTRWCPLL